MWKVYGDTFMIATRLDRPAAAEERQRRACRRSGVACTRAARRAAVMAMATWDQAGLERRRDSGSRER